MTYRGRVQSGVVVLDDPKAMVDGTVVQVEPVGSDAPASKTDPLKEVIGKIEGVLEDTSPAIHHDLDALAGTWSEEDSASFNSATAAARRIDAELWK